MLRFFILIILRSSIIQIYKKLNGTRNRLIATWSLWVPSLPRIGGHRSWRKIDKFPQTNLLLKGLDRDRFWSPNCTIIIVAQRLIPFKWVMTKIVRLILFDGHKMSHSHTLGTPLTEYMWNTFVKYNRGTDRWDEKKT